MGGVEAALLAGAALAILAAFAVQPLRGRIDADRDRAAAVSPGTIFSPQNLTAPFRVLRDRRLATFTYVGFCFAVAQGALLTFLVTFLATDVGLTLAFAGGIFAVTSWNGVYLAEVATLAPPDRVGEATSGSTFCTFIGYVVSPTLFAAIVAATGSYPGAFLLTAALPLTAALALIKRH
jgi:hypothetical protein